MFSKFVIVDRNRHNRKLNPIIYNSKKTLTPIKTLRL